MTLFDTHCHLGFGKDDAIALHARARAAGVSQMLDVGINLQSSQDAASRAETLEGVFFSAGIHPNEALREGDEWQGIEALARRDDCLAIGESGLDFYRDRTPVLAQVHSFERHLALAVELDKPIVIHCRDAYERTFEVLRGHPGVRGVMHCFAGGIEEARSTLDLGLYLSFAGPLTYPKANALRAAASFAPADRILIETDAPFLPPQPFRGKQNEPAHITFTAERLAGVRGIDPTAIATQTTSNALQLFRL